MLTAKLPSSTTGRRTALEQVLLLFKPGADLKWHRELVRHIGGKASANRIGGVRSIPFVACRGARTTPARRP